jgi:hypothetical protein
MKRRLKRLALSRETLRNLQADQLGRVVGGTCTLEFITTCQCTEANCDSGGGSGGCGSGWCPTATQEIQTCCGC